MSSVLDEQLSRYLDECIDDRFRIYAGAVRGIFQSGDIGSNAPQQMQEGTMIPDAEFLGEPGSPH